VSKGDVTLIPGENRQTGSVYLRTAAWIPRQSSAKHPSQCAVEAFKVEVFKNAGHAMFVDDAGRFNEVLAEFADSISILSDKTTN
jgi:hypothetical protein